MNFDGEVTVLALNDGEDDSQELAGRVIVGAGPRKAGCRAEIQASSSLASPWAAGPAARDGAAGAPIRALAACRRSTRSGSPGAQTWAQSLAEAETWAAAPTG